MKKTKQATINKVEAQVKTQVKTHVGGFLEFIKGQNVIGLAIGLVIGTAASALINSLINNVIMPPFGFLLGSAEGLKGLYLDLGTTPAGEVAQLKYGAFLSDFINFLVIAIVVYLVVKWLNLELKKK
ncbi:MAG: MscL family protein [Candidatus Nomurabacteria bacterium]|jgi:large conductance mechanosensitive channel|nr:MscL family protein [Candidatus Nomurabacteria bacterium]